MRARILRLLIALDIFLFAVATLGGSKRNETLSAAAWSWELRGKRRGKLLRPALDWIFTKIQADHCKMSWLAEVDKY